MNFLKSLYQSVFNYQTKSERPAVIEIPDYCVNLEFLGSKLDKARKQKAESRSNWAYHFWSQVEAQLEHKWKEAVYHFERNRQLVQVVGEEY